MHLVNRKTVKQQQKKIVIASMHSQKCHYQLEVRTLLIRSNRRQNFICLKSISVNNHMVNQPRLKLSQQRVHVLNMHPTKREHSACEDTIEY